MADEKPAISQRGFMLFPPIPADFGPVRVFESSRSDSAGVWIEVKDEGTELTLEQALKLSAQLQYLVEHHHLK
jgi:hypothetical protein